MCLAGCLLAVFSFGFFIFFSFHFIFRLIFGFFLFIFVHFALPAIGALCHNKCRIAKMQILYFVSPLSLFSFFATLSLFLFLFSLLAIYLFFLTLRTIKTRCTICRMYSVISRKLWLNAGSKKKTQQKCIISFRLQYVQTVWYGFRDWGMKHTRKQVFYCRNMQKKIIRNGERKFVLFLFTFQLFII